MSERTEADTVAVRVSAGIAWVKFNRPEKRNCMSPKLNRQMLRVLNELEFRDDVGVLVLSGEGAAWSAGMDLKEYFREVDGKSEVFQERIRRDACRWQWQLLRFYNKATIAMVNGWCFGGAFSPLVACDLAIAADEATIAKPASMPLMFIALSLLFRCLSDRLRPCDRCLSSRRASMVYFEIAAFYGG